MVKASALNSIKRAIAEGQDPWEMLISAGIQAQDHLDTGRWAIGDLALLVEKSYGEDTIGTFATAINVEAGRVKEYRTMCRFWTPSIRDQVREDFPNITYSHLREAKRLKEPEAALALVKEAASEGWTISGMRQAVNQRLGSSGGIKKLLDHQMVIQQLDSCLLVLLVNAGTKDLTTILGAGQQVRVVIYSLPEEEEAVGSAADFASVSIHRDGE